MGNGNIMLRDDEEVERIAVTVVAALVRVHFRERVDSLGEHNTVRGVRRAVADRSDNTKPVHLPALAVERAEPLEQVVHREVVLALAVVLALLLLEDLTREGAAGLLAFERHLLRGLLRDGSGVAEAAIERERRLEDSVGDRRLYELLAREVVIPCA